MAKKITFGNFKGGVGKTMTSCIFAMICSQLNRRVLFIDLDPQGNGTDLINKTFGIDYNQEKINIYYGISENNLKDHIICVNKNFSYIPSDLPLVDLPNLLTDMTKNNHNLRAYVLGSLIYDVEDEFDYIVIDTPPTISDFTNNALVASDYGVLVMQTQMWSKYSVDTYMRYIDDLNRSHNTNCEMLGIVTMLMDKQGIVDKELLALANHEYKEKLFASNIYQSQRIKRYSAIGLPTAKFDMHDKKALKMYMDLSKEILIRIGDEAHEFIK